MGWFGTRSLSAVLVGAMMMLGQATPSAASGPPAPIWSGVYAGIHGGHASADLGYTFVLGFVRTRNSTTTRAAGLAVAM